MSTFDEALGIKPEEKPAEGEEQKPDEGKEPKKKMHEYKEEFTDFAAEQKRVSGGS